jgi:cysteinyl-tRNA synthetase
VEALADTLNTPKAIAVLREQFSSRNPMDGLGKEFFQNCEFLGLVDPEKIGSLEAEHVSGSVAPKLLFDSMPIVLSLRAGVANSRPDVVEQATNELREQGVSWRDLREGFFELQPLTKDAEIDTQKIEKLLASRIAARKAKDFKKSDRIRDQLAAMGVVVKDNKDGTTTWEVAR